MAGRIIEIDIIKGIAVSLMVFFHFYDGQIDGENGCVRQSSADLADRGDSSHYIYNYGGCKPPHFLSKKQKR